MERALQRCAVDLAGLTKGIVASEDVSEQANTVHRSQGQQLRVLSHRGTRRTKLIFSPLTVGEISAGMRWRDLHRVIVVLQIHSVGVGSLLLLSNPDADTTRGSAAHILDVRVLISKGGGQYGSVERCSWEKHQLVELRFCPRRCGNGMRTFGSSRS